MSFKFNPTEAERDPANWTPAQQQAWAAHKSEQFSKGLPPYPADQFMLTQHGKFGLDIHGQPLAELAAAGDAPTESAPAPAVEPAPQA